MMARAWASVVRTIVVLLSERKVAAAGVIEPSGPNRLTGTQPPVVTVQTGLASVPLASEAWRKRDWRV